MATDLFAMCTALRCVLAGAAALFLWITRHHRTPMRHDND